MKRIILTSLASVLAVTTSALAQDKVDFQKEILPILRDSCVKCHGPEKQKAKLRLDSKADAMKGGKNGAVIKPGDSAGSEAYKRIILPKGNDDVMPNEGEPLTKAQTDLIKAWIDQGANWPDGVGIQVAVAAPKEGTAAKPAAPTVPDPELPKDFKPGAGEAAAIAAIAKSGVDVRPIAQNTPWREANFRLQGTNITDATIAPLKDVQSLVELNLATTKVTDAGLAVLKNLPYLMTLHLELTGVSDAGLAHVKDLSNLVYLNLYGSQVTDAGLENLKGLKHLKRLYVWQSKVTPEGAKKLKETLPLVDVNTGWDLASLTNATPAKAEEKKEEKK
jgi:hypothetical protein